MNLVQNSKTYTVKSKFPAQPDTQFPFSEAWVLSFIKIKLYLREADFSDTELSGN